MPPAVVASLAAAALLAGLASGKQSSEAAERWCAVGDRCSSEGQLSLLQGRGLMSRRTARRGPVLSGPFAARRSCRAALPGLVQCYPDIMLAGASKAGTTSVNAALSHHPAVVLQKWAQSAIRIGDKAVTDEAHIFDNHGRSLQLVEDSHWQSAPKLNQSRAGSVLQLQYTPNYMYFPDTPFNIVDVYPNARSAKYLFMLREPASRAVSGWKFHRQTTLELRPFSAVVRDGLKQRRALEACYGERLSETGNHTAKYVEDLPLSSQRKIIDDCFWGRPGTHDAFALALMHAHVDKGIYVDQLRRWFSVLGRENCFVFSLEEWAADANAVFSEVMDFVGLDLLGPHGYSNETELNKVLHKVWNEGEHAEVLIPEPPEPDAALVTELREFYKPYDEALFELLGRKLY